MENGNEDDILFHIDILSSPSKSTSKSPVRSPLKAPGKKHRPNRRKLLDVVRSPLKNSKESGVPVPVEIKKSGSTSETGKKRGRPRKVKDVSSIEEVKKRGRPKKIKDMNSIEDGKNKSLNLLRKGTKKTKSGEKRSEIKKESGKSNEIIKLELSQENILPKEERRKRKRIKTKLDLDSEDEIYSSEDGSFHEPEIDVTQEIDDEDMENSQLLDEDDIIKDITKSDNSHIIDDSKPTQRKKRKYTKRKRSQSIDNEDFDDTKLMENETTLLEPKTPRKEISSNYDFISPLKKTILESLKQYDNSIKNIKLNKNFRASPMPNDTNYKPSHDFSKLSTYLDTFEGYLDQKRSANYFKKSISSMNMAPDVSREEFGIIANTFNNFFLKTKRNRLLELQETIFPQYWFELSQGFNLLFYGVGSKRELMEKFAIEYLSSKLKKISLFQNRINYDEKIEHEAIPCIIINGYNPSCNYRDVYKDISRILVTEELNNNETKYWGNHIILQVNKIIEFYKTQPTDIKLILVVHNIEGPSIRKEIFQTMLSLLATIRQVAIIASTDHIYTPIIWNNIQSQNYNFIYHDVTNFEPYSVESSFQDVMKVGNSEKSQGSEGAKYVLQSLTTNSKKMFKLLVESQIANIEKESKKVYKKRKASLMFGIEFKQFSQLCATEFIASNDISLRTMLREFIEHNMACISKKNEGTEVVWVPYNYMDLKKLHETVLAGIE